MDYDAALLNLLAQDAHEAANLQPAPVSGAHGHDIQNYCRLLQNGDGPQLPSIAFCKNVSNKDQSYQKTKNEYPCISGIYVLRSEIFTIQDPKQRSHETEA